MTHSAKFEDAKRPGVHSYTLLPIDGRAAIHCDKSRDGDENRE
jgi:hypothetical protein